MTAYEGRTWVMGMVGMGWVCNIAVFETVGIPSSSQRTAVFIFT